PRRDERCDQVIERTNIEGETRPAVLTFRLEPCVELELRGTYVRGVARRITVHTDERIRFLRSCGQHAAGPVILEGAAQQMHAVGEERGGERVARKAGIAHPIESEGERARAVDASATCRTQRFVHRESLGVAGGGSPTL